MGAGAPAQTGNALDVSIQGDGYFVVGNASAGAPNAPATATPGTPIVDNGATPPASTLPTALSYTRAGNFTTDSNGFLVTQSGQYVMGYANATPTAGRVPGQGAAGTTDGQATFINIPAGSTNVSIGQNGAVTYTDANGNTQTAGYLAMATVPNEAGLTRDAGTEWSTSGNSGTPVYGVPGGTNFTDTQTISGQLEQSNVDMATEFTNMIEAERGYQANSSVIQTADTMMQTLIQMAGA